MNLHAIGLHVRHTGDFCIHRPQGSGDYLFIIFKSNAYLVLNGQVKYVAPNTGIIFDKGKEQYYYTSGKTYVNHYLHFNLSEAERIKYQDIFQTPFSMPYMSDIESLLELLSREHLSNSEYKQEYIQLLMEILLKKLSECKKRNHRDSEFTMHQDNLYKLRAEIYSNPGKYSCVEELAREMKLSDSYFQQLYKEQFMLSSYDDLLTAKILQAQFFLTTTNLNVKEIAALCGDSSEISFMRRFKKRTGMTALEYRKKNMNHASQ